MKKVLSVLLILAGLFGLYGGMITLKDVNSCKAYWEDKGETALSNIDTLNDGLDQLKENTATYNDGVKQVAQGEIDLAKGKKDLEKGKKDLAKGEADYAAAPAKLAAGRKQIAEGKASLSSLTTLIESMEAVNANFPAYKDGISQVKGGMKQLSEALQENGATLKQLGLFLSEEDAKILNSDIDVVAANKDSIEVFVENANNLVADVNKAQDKAHTLTSGVRKIASDFEELLAKFRRGEAQWGSLRRLISDNKSTVDAALEMIGNAVRSNQMDSLLSQMSGDNGGVDGGTLCKKLISLLNKVADTIDSSVNDPKIGELKAGVDTLNGGIKQLKDAQNGNPNGKTQGEKLGLAGALKAIYSGILDSTDALVPAIKAKSPQALDSMKYFLGKTDAGDVLGKADLEGFVSVVGSALELNGKLLPGFKSTYKDGKATLAAGQKELAKGLADYKAAPAQLAAGRQQLAEGKQKLAEGIQQLADGRKQLAVYEDGVKQVRDGLDTLMNEAPEGGVLSIRDRVGADEDFSLKDGSLDFDASYGGAESGRAYVNDLSAVVTKELTSRAIGFAIGMGAGVLALLAAILGFIKKNKGAAVISALAAVATGVGAYIAHSAGIELSTVAGSALGATPMMALGALGVVGLVAAIVFFVAPKAE